MRYRTHFIARSLRRSVVRLWAIAGLAACGSTEPVAPVAAPITEPSRLYMQLMLEQRAINLATADGYNTATLIATPRDGRGVPMPDLTTPTFESQDTTIVRVTPDGRLTAVRATSGATVVWVIASLTLGAVTHADTAVVRVTAQAPPPMVASFSIDPVLPDSTRVSLISQTDGTSSTTDVSTILLLFTGYYEASDAVPVHPHVLNSNGDTMDIAIEYRSLAPEILKVDDLHPRYLIPQRLGQAQIVAQSVVYGVVYADTTTYTVTLPTERTIYFRTGEDGQPGFVPTEIRIRPFGIVVWKNEQLNEADLMFDDPNAAEIAPAPLCDIVQQLTSFGVLTPGSECSAGNGVIPRSENSNSSSIQVRQFPLPGVYPYHNARTGAAGQVIVSDDPM